VLPGSEGRWRGLARRSRGNGPDRSGNISNLYVRQRETYAGTHKGLCPTRRRRSVWPVSRVYSVCFAGFSDSK
jgi:hypothetical protein